MNETKDLNKPVLPKDPVVNPEDASVPQANEGDGGNEGGGDDPPADPPPGGDHPTKKPDDPTP